MCLFFPAHALWQKHDHWPIDDTCACQQLQPRHVQARAIRYTLEPRHVAATIDKHHPRRTVHHDPDANGALAVVADRAPCARHDGVHGHNDVRHRFDGHLDALESMCATLEAPAKIECRHEHTHCVTQKNAAREKHVSVYLFVFSCMLLVRKRGHDDDDDASHKAQKCTPGDLARAAEVYSMLCALCRNGDKNGVEAILSTLHEGTSLHTSVAGKYAADISLLRNVLDAGHGDIAVLLMRTFPSASMATHSTIVRTATRRNLLNVMIHVRDTVCGGHLPARTAYYVADELVRGDNVGALAKRGWIDVCRGTDAVLTAAVNDGNVSYTRCALDADLGQLNHHAQLLRTAAGSERRAEVLALLLARVPDRGYPMHMRRHLVVDVARDHARPRPSVLLALLGDARTVHNSRCTDPDFWGGGGAAVGSDDEDSLYSGDDDDDDDEKFRALRSLPQTVDVPLAVAGDPTCRLLLQLCQPPDAVLDGRVPLDDPRLARLFHRAAALYAPTARGHPRPVLAMLQHMRFSPAAAFAHAWAFLDNDAIVAWIRKKPIPPRVGALTYALIPALGCRLAPLLKPFLDSVHIAHLLQQKFGLPPDVYCNHILRFSAEDVSL